jgi:hypothetical protein
MLKHSSRVGAVVRSFGLGVLALAVLVGSGFSAPLAAPVVEVGLSGVGLAADGNLTFTISVSARDADGDLISITVDLINISTSPFTTNSVISKTYDTGVPSAEERRLFRVPMDGHIRSKLRQKTGQVIKARQAQVQ